MKEDVARCWVVDNYLNQIKSIKVRPDIDHRYHSFSTWRKAHDYLLRRSGLEVDSAQHKLSLAQARHKKVVAMQEPVAP